MWVKNKPWNNSNNKNKAPSSFCQAKISCKKMRIAFALENRIINACKENFKRKLACLGNLGMFCCKVSYQQDLYTANVISDKMFVTIGEKGCGPLTSWVQYTVNTEISKDGKSSFLQRQKHLLLGPFY